MTTQCTNDNVNFSFLWSGVLLASATVERFVSVVYPLKVKTWDLYQISKMLKIVHFQGWIQDLIRGGPDRYRPKLPTVHSSVVQAKQALFSMGSGAHLRAPEALGYFITKYAFSSFWGTFLYYF